MTRTPDPVFPSRTTTPTVSQMPKPAPASLTSRSRPTALFAAVLAVLALVLAACGGGDAETAEDEPTPSEVALVDETPEATAEPTEEPTATPEPEPATGPPSPLTGLPAPEGSDLTRVLTVKIDNHPNARPQSGIGDADLMIEIYVEGITRFLSVWQASDSSNLGPIRSMRPTDFAIQNAWESTFVNSGGQGWVQAIGNNSNVAWFQEPSGSFRVSNRAAPHNLYGDTTAFRLLDSRGAYDEPLAPLWNFGDLSADAAEASDIVTSFPQAYQTSWSWNGEEYEKSTEGTPHVYLDADGESQQVTADTLVMLEMSISTQSGGANTTPVPVSNTVGEGVAWVFADGRMVKGTWSRSADSEWFTLTADDGSEMSVPAGRQWLILPPPGGVTTN